MGWMEGLNDPSCWGGIIQPSCWGGTTSAFPPVGEGMQVFFGGEWAVVGVRGWEQGVWGGVEVEVEVG